MPLFLMSVALAISGGGALSSLGEEARYPRPLFVSSLK
jgi:hypothetical protein